jgi:hypothetical protein
MIRIRDERGSVVIGLVRGPLLDRLLAGERVFLEQYVDGNALEHPALWLDFSGGPRKVQALVAGERVCIPRVVDETGREVHPHVCLFLRDDNAQLLAAATEYFPDGPLPGARFEHVTTKEPT